MAPEVVLGIEAEDNTRRGVRQAERNLGRLDDRGSRSLRNIGASAAKAATAIVGIGTAAYAALNALGAQAANANYQFGLMANRIGVSRGEVEALSYAADRAETDIQDLGDLFVDANEPRSGCVARLHRAPGGVFGRYEHLSVGLPGPGPDWAD